MKLFFTRFEGVMSFGVTSEQSAKVFSANLRKFSPSQVFRYTVFNSVF